MTQANTPVVLPLARGQIHLFVGGPQVQILSVNAGEDFLEGYVVFRPTNSDHDEDLSISEFRRRFEGAMVLH